MAVEISSALLYLAAFLIAAKLGGALSARIGQPGVFGELMAGIAIGPSVAGWLSQRILGGAPLFIDPASPAGEFISTLADIGIILLLFLAGLSIDADEFKRSGRAATIIAALGVVVAFMLGFGAASIFGWSSIEAAFAGGVLVATSVGITVRTLVDVNGLHTKVGMAILGAAVVDDVFGIIILSALVGLAYGGISPLSLAWILGLMGLFFLSLMLVGPRAIPRFITYADRFQVEEMALSVALALTFLIAALAEKARIAAITGAFLVGLILSKSPVAGSLRAKVSTMGYGFLIPLFFVEMGVRTDLRALAGASLLALAFLGMAIFGKVIGCGLGALLSGFGARDSLRVGVGMMPRGEVALVMATIGSRVGVVGPELYSMTVMVVLATSLITSPLVKLTFKGAPLEKA